MKATITLEYDDHNTATAITNAISPDNTPTPTGLSIDTRLNGKTVITEITLKGKLATLIATIDDLLESASTAEKTLTVLRKNSLNDIDR